MLKLDNIEVCTVQNQRKFDRCDYRLSAKNAGHSRKARCLLQWIEGGANNVDLAWSK